MMSERRIRIVIVNRNSKPPNLPLGFQVFECALPFIPIRPLRVPDVELLKINNLEAKILQTISVDRIM